MRLTQLPRAARGGRKEGRKEGRTMKQKTYHGYRDGYRTSEPVMPEATRSSSLDTGKRIPRMQGLPPKSLGSMVMRSRTATNCSSSAFPRQYIRKRPVLPAHYKHLPSFITTKDVPSTKLKFWSGRLSRRS